MSTLAQRRTRRSGVLVVGALVLAGSLAACSAADDPEPRLAELDFEPVATLVVDESGFEPSQLELESGDAITLVNEGEEPHSFVTTEPFRDTGEVLPGEEVLLRFDEPDELEAHDGAEPEHTVTIVVADSDSP